MNSIPKIDAFGVTSGGMVNNTNPFSSMVPNVGAANAPNKPSFKDTMANMIQDTNKTLALPDELMQQSLAGGNVDIHDVMIANTKADIAVNLYSQVATKVIQGYDRIQQIQV
jgi:flagellar hook-basal body complex protein FliE